MKREIDAISGRSVVEFVRIVVKLDEAKRSSSVRECAQADFSLLGATIVTRASGSSRSALAKACRPLASNPSSFVIKISFKFIPFCHDWLKFDEPIAFKFLKKRF